MKKKFNGMMGVSVSCGSCMKLCYNFDKKQRVACHDENTAFVRYNGRFGIINAPRIIANFIAG